MKLNPKKCAFVIASVLKKKNHFEWTDECQKALKDLNSYLSKPSLLAKPRDGERLLIYLAVSKVVVSAVLKKSCEYLPELILGLGQQIIDGSSNIKGESLVIVLSPLSGQVIRIASGQAESTIKVIINNLKKRLEESKGKWPEVLPEVLQAYRTTAKISTGETPFSLVYGIEALIPVEIGEPSTSYTHTYEATNEEELCINLDLTEKRREASLIRMAAQKQMIARYYKSKVNLRYFKIGDFVLKNVFRLTQMANARKLSPNYEGPYRVKGVSRKRAYEMETMDDKVLPSH
uniref:Uncharacterized protein LOC104223390 n=1 Tax=Nicotiana sylvestris TaxID=4096 RepID=A0A1U7WFV8_NICSY|nr:PREDICTED: uncharacterized protein LOC104223390 [Nicotiana sylvestris]